MARINRHTNALANKGLYYGEYPLQLLGRLEFARAGSGGFSSHLYDVCAGLQQDVSLVECVKRLGVEAAVAEGIRGYVEDAHDKRTLLLKEKGTTTPDFGSYEWRAES